MTDEILRIREDLVTAILYAEADECRDAIASATLAVDAMLTAPERWVLAIMDPVTSTLPTFSTQADAKAACGLVDVECWPVKVAG